MAADDLWTSNEINHIQYGKLIGHGCLLTNVTMAYNKLIDKIDVGSPTAINSGKYEHDTTTSQQDFRLIMLKPHHMFLLFLRIFLTLQISAWRRFYIQFIAV